MIHNRPFEKSLALLTHPLSLAALGLMLVNDQVLRRLSPSWWTGKLSDIAWVFVVPFVAAALLAWLVPGKNHPARHEAWTFALAFALTGMGFVLVKTIPAANDLATRIFYAISGQIPALRLDPSDLLALPALALSFWLWRSTRKPAHPLPDWQRAARVMVLLPAAMLVLLADAAAPDPGITCFAKQGAQIYAQGGYDSSFVSQDGGITWQVHTPGAPIDCAPKNAVAAAEWVEVPGPRPDSLYRYLPDAEIQVSTDAGKSWKTGLKFAKISAAERIYYLKSRQGSPIINPGPLDAIADPVSGNMLFAMGQQGILVHTAEGQWQWRQGGVYQRPEAFPSTDALFLLLGGMGFLALGLALLLYATLALRWTKHWLRLVLLVLAWLAWLGVVVIFPPATSYSYSDMISWLGILALGVIIVPLTIEQTVRVAKRSPRDLPRLLGFALAAGLLFLVPYFLWVTNVLPEFQWAMLLSLGQSIVILAAGWLVLRRNGAKTAG